MYKEKLPKRTAFGVFGSDALSSIAYAPGELIHQFVLAGVAVASLSYLLPIAIVISVVVIVLITLYRFVIVYYPSGGGTYTVAKEHLGELSSLLAAVALILDYTLTVSVSVAAGVAQLGSIFGVFDTHRVLFSILVIGGIAIINLRGYREAGNFFAIPLYTFVGTFMFLLLAGLFSWFSGALPRIDPAPLATATLGGGVGMFLVLRAFASGSTALTGIEAISNGVPVFRDPSVKNARTTLAVLGAIIVVFLIGTSFLTRAIGLVPENPEILIPTLGKLIFPTILPDVLATFVIGILTVAMTTILLIAANTAFVGLPQLASLLGRDRFLPTQFQNRGDRQVYSIGIIILAIFASCILWIFGGRVSALIPLYGIGVFTTFSLLGWSMVRRVINSKAKTEKGRAAKGGLSMLLVGGISGIVTSVVLVVFILTKFLHGAFAVLIVIPLFILAMKLIRKSYMRYESGLVLEEGRKFHARPVTNTVIIALGRIDRAALKAINRAQDIAGRKIAVHVSEEEEKDEEFLRKWEELETGIPLVLLKTEYNSIVASLLDYIKKIKEKEDVKEAGDPSYIHHIYVVIAEVVPKAFFANFLHNQTAFFLYEELRAIPEITPILVRYIPEKVPLGERLWGLFRK